MATYTYDTTVPAANDAPKNDQPIMLTNTASISGLIATDHIGFNTANGGYHTIIHQGPQGSDPVSIAGYGQTYTKTVSGDQQLFYESGNGIITQLTGPNNASASTNGYTWLPGKILLQWGIVTPISSTGTINLISSGNINFPTNLFSIVATLGPSSPPTTNSQTISIYNTGTTGFSYNYTGGSAYNRFRWIAIGN